MVDEGDTIEEQRWDLRESIWLRDCAGGTKEAHTGSRAEPWSGSNSSVASDDEVAGSVSDEMKCEREQAVEPSRGGNTSTCSTYDQRPLQHRPLSRREASCRIDEGARLDQHVNELGLNACSVGKTTSPTIRQDLASSGGDGSWSYSMVCGSCTLWEQCCERQWRDLRASTWCGGNAFVTTESEGVEAMPWGRRRSMKQVGARGGDGTDGSGWHTDAVCDGEVPSYPVVGGVRRTWALP